MKYMINSITVTNHLGESITIELRFPEKSGFLVRSIEGLGPSKADIGLTELSLLDGSVFNSARVTKRNLVLRLVFLEFPTIEETRLNSYKYFPIKKEVTIEVETDKRHAVTKGYIESNEPTIFSKDEGTTISILCPSSYFHELQDSFTSFATVTPLFQFPFSNESLTEKLIKFGSISADTQKNIYYTGDSPVGIVFVIHASGAVNDISITKVGTSQTISISSAVIISITGSDIIAGDDIIISTVVGDKYAVLIRNNVEYNIINAIGMFPTWFQLERGDNLFSYAADTGITNLQFMATNKIAYEGI